MQMVEWVLSLKEHKGSYVSMTVTATGRRGIHENRLAVVSWHSSCLICLGKWDIELVNHGPLRFSLDIYKSSLISCATNVNTALESGMLPHKWECINLVTFTYIFFGLKVSRCFCIYWQLQLHYIAFKKLNVL